MAPASANSAPAVSMFWADVSRTNQPTVTFYLMTNVTIKNLEASDFYVFGSATGCTVDDSFSQSSFHVVTVRGCSDGTVAVQLGANSVLDLSLNWGPAEGFASDFTTIDRTGPEFVFDQQLTSVLEASFTLAALATEQVQLVDALMSPTLSGNGCSISGVSIAAEKHTFAISGCMAGAESQLTIYANSYKDAIGNLGPAQNVVSPVVKVQSAVVPAPTASPSTSPTPTSTPIAEATPVAIVQPPIEPPPAPEPPALNPVINPEAEAVVPMAPIASIRAIESAAGSTPVAPPALRIAASVAQPQPVQPDALTNPLPAPKTEVITEPEPQVPASANAPVANLGWVMPVAYVVSIALGAVAGGLLVRSRLARKPRLRVA